MRSFRADLHIHSCLSPCGSLYSSPREIARTARLKGLDLIALTDHNSALNCPAFARCCMQEGIQALYGMEVTSREEVHCLALFETVDQALEFGELVDRHMHRLGFDPRSMGDQVVVDEHENIIGEVEYLLIAACGLGIQDLEKEIQSRGGLFIPAHVDRSSFSMISQLGFIPEGNYDALEWRNSMPGPGEPGSSWPAIQNSDAHFPEDIGTRFFEFRGLAADFPSLREWLRQGPRHHLPVT